MRIYLILAVVFYSLSCVQKPVRVTPLEPRDHLFPYATYQHRVRVRLVKPLEKGPQQFEFQGVVFFQKDHLKMLALSPFGTTLFRVDEDFKSKEIKIEIFVDELKKYENKIKPFYEVTRDVLTLPLNNFAGKGVKILQKTDKGLPERIGIYTPEMFSAPQAQVLIKSYDKLNIPKEFDVQAPEFEFNVVVEKYDF